MQKPAQKPSTILIGKMPFIRQYPLFQNIRVPSYLKHIHIVVSFNNECVYPQESFNDSFVICTQVCAHSDRLFTVIHPVSHRLKGIMTDSHRLDTKVIDHKIIICRYFPEQRHIDGADTLLQCDAFNGSCRGIHRQPVFSRQHTDGCYMIRMLVCYENSGQIRG